MDKHLHLTRRERQIMDILYAQGEVSVNDIQKQLPDPPAHTAVRTMLKILDGKGLVKRRKLGREHLYSARPRRTRTGRSAMQRVVQTFFDGSLEKAVGVYLAGQKNGLSEQERQRLHQMIDEPNAVMRSLNIQSTIRPIPLNRNLGVAQAALVGDETASESDASLLPAPSPAALLPALKARFAALLQAVEDEDVERAKQIHAPMTTQVETFVKAMEGSPAEAGIRSAVGAVKQVGQALEAGDLAQARMLLQGLNAAGPQLERMVQKASD